MTALAPVLQGFFADRLAQRGVSPHTVTSYRDTWRLLLTYARDHTGTAPSALDLDQIDADLVGAFLDHLETDRANSARTRNLRLTAIHSLFTYAALRCPEHAATIQRVLAIPAKRPHSRLVTYLTRDEADALLAAPDRSSRSGRRDHTLLAVAVATGLRVSELTGLTATDVTLGVGAHLRCHGKGRKDRITPLNTPLARLLADWLAELRPAPTDPVFPTHGGGRLSSDAVADLLAKHLAVAIRTCPSLAAKHVTPHTLRHTAAMDLLHAGVDTTVIALWLGHASTRSTNPYLHADLTIKEAALALTAPHPAARQRYKPTDSLLAFLENL
jgi:integrase/recombinase XerD